MASTDSQRKQVDKHFSANLQSISTDQGTKYYLTLHSPLGLKKEEIDKESYDAITNSKENVSFNSGNNVSLKSETAAKLAIQLYPTGTFKDFEYLYAKSKPTPETQQYGNEAQTSVALMR